MKISLSLLILFFVIIICSCGQQTARAKNIILYENDGSTEEIVLENEYLELRFFPQTTQIILTDKTTGVQWKSNPFTEKEPHDPLADYVTMQMMQSQFTLQYNDLSGVGETLYSKEHSIDRNAYSYALADGVLEVNYTVGNLARTYIIPPAIPEERMKYFLDKIESDSRRRIEASYRLYDINNLRENDDRDTLLLSYPDLNRTNIYVLRDSTQDWMKEQIEGFLSDAGYTYDDYLEDIERYPSAAADDRPAFNITLRYALDGKSLLLQVPFDKIAYRRSYPITRLSLLPFMGAGGLEDEGYLFVPDGSGALIYFNNGKHNQLAYTNDVYGWDEAMPRDAVINENRAHFPVFGIQKINADNSGSALLCVIEEGAAYASIFADVSGRNNSWNSVFPQFSLIHSARMEISGRSERMLYHYERGLSEGESIVLRYTICEEDGYVGMAKEYRAWLLDKYPALAENKIKNDEVPIAIEIVGAVNKTQHRFGIPFDRPLRLTSYKEAAGMINHFSNLGWKNVNIKLNGWFNRSVEHTVPSDIKLIKELGSRRMFRRLIAAADNSNYQIYPEVDFMFMRDNRLFDGFNLYRDSAQYISRKRAEKYPFSFVWFGERTRWGKLNYLASPAYSMNLINTFINKAKRFNLNNIAFRNIGAQLAGDYNERRHVSREASMLMRKDKLETLSNSGKGIMLHSGFVYAVPWADFIIDMPMDCQNFGITDTAVPFYQIVLHGLVPYTGRAINLAEDYTLNLLKTIEGGAGLYFSFMIEETSVLQETKFRQFYANEFHKWIDDADALYKKFSADFAGLYSQAITGHEIPSPNVTITEYEDGTKVIVNRGDINWNYNDIIIQAKNYFVLRQ